MTRIDSDTSRVVGLMVMVGLLLVLGQVGSAPASGSSGASSSRALHASAATLGVPGVTSKTVTVMVGSRSFPARLSYPTRGGNYPALAFGHGYLARASWYASTLDALAQTGIVMIAPDSETGAGADPSRFADDLNRSLAWLASESRAEGTAVPRGKVDGSRTAVAGHSMGGGAALLAAARSRTVDTVATLAAGEPSPPAASAARWLRVASLFVVGSDDRTVPAADTAMRFRRAPPPSLFASITGGSHCGFVDNAPPGCDRARISYPRQRALTRELLRRWFGRYLRGITGTSVTGVQGISYTRSGASPGILNVYVSIHLNGKPLAPGKGYRGRFTMSGALSDHGSFSDRSEVGGRVRTLFGAKGTIRIKFVARTPNWTITKGTKAYAGLRGRGSESGAYSPDTIDITMEGTVSQ